MAQQEPINRETYHQRTDIIGSSMLRVFRRSPYEYWRRYVVKDLDERGDSNSVPLWDTSVSSKPTPGQLALGSWVHAHVLEDVKPDSDEFRERFAEWGPRIEEAYRYRQRSNNEWVGPVYRENLPGYAQDALAANAGTVEACGLLETQRKRSGSEWEAFMSACQANGLIDITTADIQLAREIYKGVHHNEVASELITRPGAMVEQPYEWTCEASGMRLKYMGDLQFAADDRSELWDLKTTHTLSALVDSNGTLTRYAERGLCYPHSLAFYGAGYRKQFGEWPVRAGWIVCDKTTRETVVCEIDSDELRDIYERFICPELCRLAEYMETHGKVKPWQDVTQRHVRCSDYLRGLSEPVDIKLPDGSTIAV